MLARFIKPIFDNLIGLMLETLALAGHRRRSKRRRRRRISRSCIVCFRVISVRVCSEPACTLFFLPLSVPVPLNRELGRLRNRLRVVRSSACCPVPESRYASFTEQWTEAGRDKVPANCPPSDLFPLWSFLCSPVLQCAAIYSRVMEFLASSPARVFSFLPFLLFHFLFFPSARPGEGREIHDSSR